MTYYSGTVSSTAALRSAIESALVTEGWVNTSGILSKSDMAIRFVSSTNAMNAFFGTGVSGSSIVNEGPWGVGFAMRTSGTLPMIYPAVYHIYAYDTEVYVGLNWNSNYYQWLSFGKYQDMPAGEGHYLSGPTCTWRGENTAMSISLASVNMSNISTVAQSTSTAASSNTIRPPLITNSNQIALASVDGTLKWYESRTPATTFPNQFNCGTDVSAPLIYLTPGLVFYTSLMGVIMGGCEVNGANVIKLFGRLKYARYVRNDYLLPGEQLTFGSEVWSVWPMDRRVVATSPNGYLAFAFLEE